MEQEIDLRYYIEVVVRYRKWILGFTAAAMVVATLVSLFVLPPTYEVVATVVATAPRYRITLVPQIEAPQDSQVPTKAYIALAKNAQLERQIITALGDTLPGELRSVQALDAVCSVSSADDPSIIQLKVRYSDPQVAADVANTWAVLYVRQISTLYGQSDDVRQLEEHIDIVGEKLQAAEQAIIEFQKTNPMTVLCETIKAYSEGLTDYIRAETDIQLALQDVESLKRQLQTAATTSPGLVSDLSALLIELNTLSVRRDLGAPIQISLAASAVGEASISQRIQRLDSLIATLKAKEQARAVAREEIPPKILEAQGELQQAEAELDRLQRTRDVARDAYLALSRKAEELRIAIQMEACEVHIVSEATAPAKPVSPRKALNAALAGVVGLMAGIMGAFVAEYFKQPPSGPFRPSGGAELGG